MNVSRARTSCSSHSNRYILYIYIYESMTILQTSTKYNLNKQTNNKYNKTKWIIMYWLLCIREHLRSFLLKNTKEKKNYRWVLFFSSALVEARALKSSFFSFLLKFPIDFYELFNWNIGLFAVFFSKQMFIFSWLGPFGLSSDSFFSGFVATGVDKFCNYFCFNMSF